MALRRSEGRAALLAALLGIGMATGCEREESTPPTQAAPPVELEQRAAASASARQQCKPAPVYAPSPAERERDEIFSLTAFAVALRGWQDDVPSKRGANIAAILVDEKGRIVCWARQATHVTHDKTQHAEVRVIQTYLSDTARFDVTGHSLYVTLEPCAMCAGMIAMTRVNKVLFGQRAADSGRAFDRLQLDSTAIGGYCPYPYPVVVHSAPSSIGSELGQLPESASTRTEFSPAKRAVLAKAAARLDNYRVEYRENEATLRMAQAFLEQVPREYIPAPYKQGCPPRTAPAVPSSRQATRGSPAPSAR